VIKVALRYFITKEVGSVAASGGTATLQFSWHETVHVKRIYIIERSGASLENVDVTIKWGEGDVLTREKVPCILLSYAPNAAIEIDRDLQQGLTVKFEFTNNGSSAVNLVVVFECV